MFVQNVETKELLCGELIQSRFALLFQSTVPSVSCLDLTVVVDLHVCAERDKRREFISGFIGSACECEIDPLLSS
jgi:hypothetical protein